MSVAKTFELPNNRKLEMVYDESPDSPRNWDNLCKMIFIGGYSHLGDKHDFHDKHDTLKEHGEYVAKQLDAAFIAPVYAYVHSGMTISLTPFSCRWDSGCLGWVVITKKDLRENYGVKRITQKLIDKAMDNVKGEIKILDQYIGGEVFGFIVKNENDEQEDSCFGFYGDDIKTNGILDYIEEEDREAILKGELV